MNEAQKRLLILYEFKFYELQVGKSEFLKILEKLGISDPRDSGNSKTDAFSRANEKLRQYLRTSAN